MRQRLAYLGRTALMLAFLGAAATPASADWLLTPYLGLAFGGSADFGDVGDLEDNLERRITFGASASWMGAGIVGFEVDFASTPNFFQITTGDSDFEFGDGHVTTLMGNVIVGAPIGGQTGPGVRPYGTAGIGLLRSSIDGGDFFEGGVDSSDLGFNLGAGAHVFFADNIGLRGDVRYFRAMQGDGDGDLGFDIEDFDYWRGTIGVTFRFGQ